MKARIFGAGSIGNHLCHALRKKNYKVEVVDIDNSALIRMERDIYPARYGEWDKEIKLSNSPTNEFVDLEIIGTPPDTHSQILIDRLKLKRSSYWLVEKPFTIPSSIHISNLRNAISNQSGAIFVGYNHSISPAFIELLEDLDNAEAPLNIKCSWLEHWGGIFKAHPWLDGPNDSYLGFNKRGGGALMEHSHGLHLLTIVFEKYNAKIKNIKKTIVMDKEGNYDKKTFLSFSFEDNNFNAFYNTDVISKEVKKSITIETKSEIFSIEFSSDNGLTDTYIRKNKFNEIQKKFNKIRADDFLYEIDIIDKFIKKDINISKYIKNISCEKGLKVAAICANIFEN